MLNLFQGPILNTKNNELLYEKEDIELCNEEWIKNHFKGF